MSESQEMYEARKRYESLTRNQRKEVFNRLTSRIKSTGDKITEGEPKSLKRARRNKYFTGQ